MAQLEFRHALRFCAPELFCPPQGITPVNGVRGKATMSTKCSSGAVPGDPLVSFPSLGKKLAPQGETLPPPAGGEIPLRGTKPLYHRPLIRHGFAVPPSPQGEGFCGESLIGPSGHLLPRERLWNKRRNEVSHKVLCQAFFQESGKTLSSRDWDESVSFASWCHPISERPGRSLWTPCCGGGAAPVSRPAGGAVFGRVRLRGVLSTWGRRPWDLSLSGGIPVTHAPSWR